MTDRIFEQSFSIDGPILETMIARVKCAQSNDEKKRTFESLVDYLFSSVEGWSLEPNRYVKTGEIDRIVMNDGTGHAFFDWIGTSFPIEVKNWNKKVSVKEANHFLSKVRRARCKMGVLVSTHGISGDRERNAMRAIKDAFLQDGTLVVLLDLHDIVEVAEGRNLLELLRRRLEDMRYY